MTMGTPAALVWTGSRGAGAAHRDRVLELHRLHFVEKRGHAASQDVVRARAQDARLRDAQAEKAHKQWLHGLHSTADAKLKNALAHGSMSVWSKDEKDRIEELRQDPDEARERMASHTKELARTHKAGQAAMTDRVKALPTINRRGKEEMARIEEQRLDPDEAKAVTKAEMEARQKQYKQEKAAMVQRVKQNPAMSLRSKEEVARIEELRQDPDEAKARMAAHLQTLARAHAEESNARQARVAQIPPLNIRPPEEHAEIEARRQDPEEARQQMQAYAKELERMHKQKAEEMHSRVRAVPKLNFRSKAERDIIEEARRDPFEARDRMTQEMKQLARSAREQKNAMRERVDGIPAMTFRAKEQRERMDEARTSKKPLTART